MTNKEAIEMIASMGKYLSSGNPMWETEPVKEATDMAIEALKENNRSDSLVRDDAENCKESESKLDLIRRQDALKPFCIAPDGTRIPEVDCDNFPVEFSVEFIKKHLLSLPSAEPQPKPISYIECANAMLKMWIDNVLTDGEYYRIMEKLNSKHMADMRGGDDSE